MNGQTPTPRAHGRLWRLGKYLFIVVIVLAVAILAAHLIWKYSGSSEWKLVQDKNGIKIYAMKVPGSTGKKFKGIVRVRSTLSTAVKLLQDPHVCDYDHIGCYDSKTIQMLSDRSGYYSFRWKYPSRFQPREFLVKATFTQDPRTKEVFETVDAAPDRLPPDGCCVRITEMHNTWRLTPVGNGQVEIEYVVDTSAGGYFPYFLTNLGGPIYIPRVLSKLQGWTEKEKYQNATLSFIQE
jgi:hypothetical protein